MKHAQRHNRSIEVTERKMRGYFNAAKARHHLGGICEIDDDAEVSLSEDKGAYVQAWIWISDLEVQNL